MCGRLEGHGISVRNEYKEAHGKDLVTCEANNGDGRD